MVAHSDAATVRDADEPRREMRPAALDLPVEVRAFDGGHREITQDEIERGPLLNRHKCCGAVGNHLHVVAVARQDISNERPHLGTGLNHQDARWHTGAPRTGRCGAKDASIILKSSCHEQGWSQDVDLTALCSRLRPSSRSWSRARIGHRLRVLDRQ